MGKDGLIKSKKKDSKLLQSKKFMAYLIANGIALVMFMSILVFFKGEMTLFVWALLMTIVTLLVFLEVGYILGKASLDKFTRVAEINARLGVPTQIHKNAPLQAVKSLVSPDDSEEEADEDEDSEE